MRGNSFFVLIVCLLCASCTFRKIQRKVAVSSDTVKTSFTRSETNDSYSSRAIVLKDTVIRIGQKSVSGLLKLSELLPLRNAAGNLVPQSFTATKNGLQARLTVGADSTIEYGATMDSILFVVENLRREVSELRVSSTVKTDTAAVQVKQRMTYEETYVRLRAFTLANLGWIVSMLALVAILCNDRFFHFKKTR